MRANHRNRGFSLVELMIAMVAGLVVSYAVLAFTMSSMKNNGEFVQSTQLTQELRNTLDLATRELKRAGYDQAALGRIGNGSGSPFSPMLVSAPNTDSSCVIFGYDKAGGTDGSVDVGNGEVRGLRRVVVGGVGIVEFGASTGTTRPDCAADSSAGYASYPPACTGTWCPLSDPRRVDVTRFRINNTESGTAGSSGNQVRVRELSIDLVGRRVGDNGTNYLNGVDTTYDRSISSSVKIRSECARTVITQCDVSP